MANTEIIIRNDAKFKSDDLNNAVKSFDKFFSGINKNWRDACILMYRLANGKKYEADGFKSVADFAETIGIEKSTAHKMADAGMVYDSKVPAIAQFADKAGYTKAAKVASIVKDGKSEDLAKAIESGEISSDDSVADISSWKATKAAQAKGDKVLSKFEVDVKKANGDTVHYDSIELENVPEIEGLQKVGMVKRGDNSSPCAVYINSVTLETVVVQYSKVKKEPKAARRQKAQKAAKDLTKEDLIALAESMGMKISF